MKFLDLFRQQPSINPPAAEMPTVRDSLFSTMPVLRNKRVSLYKRQVDAMAKTFQRGIESLTPRDAGGNAIAIDYALDSAYPDLTTAKLATARSGFVPIQQLEFFANQGFIGWQLCGLLAQNWLIDKVCGVPAKDAIRKGYNITLNDGSQIDPKILNEMRLFDKKMNIKGKMRTFVKKGRIFGIRHALFMIDGIDYAAPFNPDGIRPGSYRGITQVDPYWITPELDGNAAANPGSPDFYEPTWWRLNGIRIHRSHFVIMRNDDEVVDILKPSYYYGGISIPQKIYERVFAAEKCANEAPLLLLSKRMTTYKTDTTNIFGPDNEFNSQMQAWTEQMNNFAVRVHGMDDEIQQFETALTEVNDVIMGQYALVCAAANCPITKIMGTPPKGMDATGEYDEASYHEELESIQEDNLTPLVERHHLCAMRSYIAPKFGIDPLNTEIVWKPLDSYTTKELAEINEINMRTATGYATAGAVDGFDIRSQLVNDPYSNFNGIDPVVPNGPGDREHEQEVSEQLLENSNAPQESKKAKESAVMDSALYAGVLYRAGDKILLMKRAEDRVGGGLWSFPAGHIDDGETSLDAAMREFWEETGKKITTCTPMCDTGDFVLYCAYGDEFVPMLDHEHTAYVWAGVENLPSPLHPGVADQVRMISGSGVI